MRDQVDGVVTDDIVHLDATQEEPQLIAQANHPLDKDGKLKGPEVVCRTQAGYALETWMVDHDGRGLAAVARELAFLDAQGGRPQGFAGAREDRNARLFVAR